MVFIVRVFADELSRVVFREAMVQSNSKSVDVVDEYFQTKVNYTVVYSF